MDPVLLILAGVTAFIIFRLISVMGTRTGHEQNHDLDALKRSTGRRRSDEDEADSTQAQPVPAPKKPVSAQAQPLRNADADFDETSFLAGARSAYEMIVEAFASGDLRSIRPFLSESVYAAFKSAVAARDDAQHTTDLKFVGIERANIVDSAVDEENLRATVAFMSNQVRVTRDKDGSIIDGDPNRIDLVKDKWVFSRKLKSRDPNWILVATGVAA